jgi:hypothetical protein
MKQLEKNENKKDTVPEIEEQLRRYRHVMQLWDDKLVKLWNRTQLGQGNTAGQTSRGTKELESIWRK